MLNQLIGGAYSLVALNPLPRYVDMSNLPCSALCGLKISADMNRSIPSLSACGQKPVSRTLSERAIYPTMYRSLEHRLLR
jgi:hypothetical protein